MRLVAVFLLSFSITVCSAQIENDSAQVTRENDYPYALVAGGSKGIGYAIAEALAKRKYNLVLVARHQGPLDDAREKLESKYHVNVETIAKDQKILHMNHRLKKSPTGVLPGRFH
jgi:short-subunit dehydrogenase